ncbi:MAG: hypothetical protein Q9169_007164 [Polycauliona sp. 2 TL-2023]
MLWISLLYLIPLPVSGYNDVPPYTGPGIPQCFPELCWVDSKGSGFMAGEPLAGYMGPETNVSIQAQSGEQSNRTGNIVLFSADKESHLDSAMLGATIIREPAVNRFKRYITDTAGKDIGFMIMQRPNPDPDTLFQKLAQDPLFETFPANLRSAVDPQNLIPPRTESCGVFYSGPKLTNTACLPAITSPPPSPEPPHVSMSPSSVYVVYQPAHIFDDCRNWVGGVAGPPVTLSYPASALSSLEYQSNAPPATKTIDYADLPCPPSNVAEAYDPQMPYFPVLKSEFGVKYNLRLPDWGAGLVGDSVCKIATVRDPPVHAFWVGEITGLGDEGGLIP